MGFFSFGKFLGISTQISFDFRGTILGSPRISRYQYSDISEPPGTHTRQFQMETWGDRNSVKWETEGKTDSYQKEIVGQIEKSVIYAFSTQCQIAKVGKIKKSVIWETDRDQCKMETDG